MSRISLLCLDDCELDIDETSVDRGNAASCFDPGFQGDLVAIALAPLPNRELPGLPFRDPQLSTLSV